jgi:biotin carboxyl carrier protein
MPSAWVRHAIVSHHDSARAGASCTGTQATCSRHPQPEVEIRDEVLAAGPTRRKTAAAAARDRGDAGLVIEVKAAPGQRVAAGEALVVVEAMKMQNELPSTMEALVKEVKVKPGQTVAAGDVLLTLTLDGLAP